MPSIALLALDELPDGLLADLLQLLLDAETAARPAPAPELETCVYCRSESVDVTGLGAVPTTIESDDWTGIDGNGDPVCAMCWCGACQTGHIDDAERDACEVGVDVDNPPCSIDPDRIYEMRTGR